jgi:hypothetical protein
MQTALLIGTSATPTLPIGGTMACALDRHLGPYDAVPELNGWLGADWCRCRCCGSPITRRTTLRNAA